MKKQILSLLLVLCMVLSMVPVSVFATDDVEVVDTETKTPETVSTEADNLWDYNTVEGGVELTAYNGTTTDVYVPSFIEVGSEKLSVLKLADGIFKDNDALNSVSLGKGILEIGAEAFYDCDNLVCILISEELVIIGDRAFYSCDSFNSVILYDAVESIGADAFAECPKLTIWCNDNTAGYTYATKNGITVEILNPDAQPEIIELDGITYYIMNGEAIVIDCDDSLVNVVVPETVKGYPVMEIRGAFVNCEILEHVKLPEGIRAIGEYSFRCCYKLIDVNIPTSVTEIGQYVFSDCWSLLEISIPEGITTIEYDAFWRCKSLKTVMLPEGLETIGTSAFYDCESLCDIILPSTLTYIGWSAFENCKSLESIVIPSGVTFLENEAFQGCQNLEKVVLPDTLEHINYSVFEDCASLSEITIPESVTGIDYYTFKGCVQLRSVVIPESVVSLYDSTFDPATLMLVYENSYAHTFAVDNNLFYVIYDGVNEPEFYSVDGVFYHIVNNEAVAVGVEDLNITTVEVPDNVSGYPVKELRSTFRYCTSLESVKLPEGLVVIKENTFNGCTKLTDINLPSTVTTIGEYAFNQCENLEQISLPPGLTTISEYVFAETALTHIEIPEATTLIGKSAFQNCLSLRSVTIPGSVEHIELYAFAGCDALTDVSLSYGVKVIGDCAFEDCISLTEVNVPGSVEKLTSAFSGCTNLEKVHIEFGLKYIANQVFKNCVKLKEIVIPDSVTGMSGNAFDYSSIKQVVIPESVTEINFNGTEKITTMFLVYEGSYAQRAFDSFGVLNSVYDGEKALDLFEVDGISYCIMGEEAVAYCADDSLLEATVVDTVNGYPVTTVLRTFLDCKLIEKVNLPNSIKTIDDRTFYNCYSLKEVNIAEGVLQIGQSVFYNCNSLEEILLPDSLEVIDKEAFSDCNGLLHIEIPQNVKTLKSSAFYHCDNLLSVHIPGTVKVISESAFAECVNLRSIIIDEGVLEIGNSAFCKCIALEEILLPDSLEKIGSSAFSNCDGLLHIEIPQNVKTLKSSAFYHCDNLLSVHISGSFSYIDVYVFQECANLRSVIIDEGVNHILLMSFLNCKNLTYVSLPPGLIGINSMAFNGCSRLKTVSLPETTTGIARDSFDPSTVFLVCEDAPIIDKLKELDLRYFIMHKTENPLVSYGTGLTGTVTYTDGSAASGATVEILYDDGTVKESVVADENGTYTFTYAEVGAYTIRATDALGNTSNTQVSVKRMNVFEVFIAGDTNLVLKKGYTVSGSVNEGGAKVTLTDENGNVIQNIVADENGNFTFDNVPNGTYIVTAEGENGSVSQEVTVFNGSISDLNLTIAPLSATVWGYVEVEDRDKKHHRRNWVEVTIYNSEGIAVVQQKTDKDGKYIFNNLPIGEYSIVAEAYEMRPDKHHKFDRNHKLTGYVYVSVTEAGEHQADAIVLREVNEILADFNGKVTANGETQDCKVILRDSDKNEIAYVITGKNGKFSFSNIRDGVYQIIAITKSDGVGYTVITIKDGVVYGDTDIRVYKSDKIERNEAEFEYDVPICNTRAEALEYKDRIAKEKRFYDSLSEKEKKQLSEYYVERLDKLSQWISNVQCETPEGVVLEQGGLVVTDEEIKNESEVIFNLNVESVHDWQVNANGVESKEDYLYHDVKDKAGDREIQQYYEITMSKTVDGKEKVITNVCKDTDSTGKFRITMPIPEEYRGKKHYSMVHVHNGETVILVDLDDNPDTITVEVDRFSTFVLTATDEVLASAVEDEVSCEFEGATISLGGNIAVNFHFTLTEEVVNDKNAKVVFTLPNGSKRSVFVRNIAPNEDGYYVFSCEVAAKEMASAIKAQIITSTDESEVFAYSVKEYAEYILASTDAKYEAAKPLAKAMLNYGAYAQVYFGYNEEYLANQSLSTEEKKLADADFSMYKYSVTGKEEGVAYYGSRLSLESETAIKHYFIVEDAKNIPKITVNEKEVTAKKKGGYYEIKISDILAQNLDAEITLKIGDITLNYNAFSYGYLANKTGDINLKNVMNALYAYNLAADAYA